MNFIFIKIAFRNLFRHRAKSLIVGGLIFLVSFIMTIGNGVIKGMNAGLRKNVVEGFTGHIVLISTNQLDKEVFGSMSGRPIALMNDYSKTEKVLKSIDYIQDFLPIGRNVAMVLTETRIPIFWLLISVDMDMYQRFFNSNLIVIEGDSLLSNDSGVLLGSEQRDYAANFFNIWFYPIDSEINYSNMPPKVFTNRENLEYKTDAVLMGLSEDFSGDVRLPVKGIVKFKNLNRFFGGFVFVDRKSFVEIFNYIVEKIDESKISEKEKKILKEENLDSLLEEELFATSLDIRKEGYKTEEIKKAIKKEKVINYNLEAYNSVLIKLKNKINEDIAVKKINEELKKSNCDAKAITWREATPQLAQMIGMIQGTFSIIILLLFLVSFIVVMNTISMSVIERISEIGTMRAIGAQKTFIGRLIHLESLILGLVFGGTGVITGAITCWVIRLLKLTSKNEMLQLVFGGETFSPLVGFGDIFSNILVLILVVFLAVLYPAGLAKKVTPLEAIVRE